MDKIQKIYFDLTQILLKNNLKSQDSLEILELLSKAIRISHSNALRLFENQNNIPNPLKK